MQELWYPQRWVEGSAPHFYKQHPVSVSLFVLIHSLHHRAGSWELGVWGALQGCEGKTASCVLLGHPHTMNRAAVLAWGGEDSSQGAQTLPASVHKGLINLLRVPPAPTYHQVVPWIYRIKFWVSWAPESPRLSWEVATESELRVHRFGICVATELRIHRFGICVVTEPELRVHRFRICVVTESELRMCRFGIYLMS